MIDFLFIGTIINSIWTFFSILFVLYRFTSFFTVLYGFFKFCKKLFNGLIYIKNQIKTYIINRNTYSYTQLNEENQQNFSSSSSSSSNSRGSGSSNSFLTQIKLYYYKFIGKISDSTLPIYNPNSSGYTTIHQDFSSEQLNPLYDSNYSTTFNNALNSSKYSNIDTEDLNDSDIEFTTFK